MVFLAKVEMEHGCVPYKVDREQWFRGTRDVDSGEDSWTAIPLTGYIPPEVLAVVQRLLGAKRTGVPASRYELVAVDEATGADKSRADMIAEIRRRKAQLTSDADGCEIGMNYCSTAREDKIRAQIATLQGVLDWAGGRV